MFLMLLTMLISACGKEKLTPLNTALDQVMGYGNVDAHFCTSPPSPAKQYLKYLFIVDHSQSNQPGFPNPLTPNDISNTDPNGARRYGPMVNFVQNLNPDPNNITSFGLIDFADQATQPGNLNNLQGFDSDAADFVQIAKTDWIGGGSVNNPVPTDGGFTNYQGALQLAYQLIHDDANTEAALKSSITTSYVIIFVSDGVPTVASSSGANQVYTQTFNDDISPVINNLMNLKNDPTLGSFIGNITLNTAYYFNSTSDASALSLLQQMASAGNGTFIQFGSGQNILYQQFAPPSRQVVNQLADVFVQNENAVWWDDGRFLADSDGDGLPDLIEMQMGSDPHKRDSDGNGVSDLVEYRTKGKPCNDATCQAANRDPYAICSGYSPITGADGSVSFSYSAGDGMNDCEKFVTGGTVANFNTNSDLIPDQYAYFNALPILPGTANTAFADPFGDGVSNYSKLKLGLPISVSKNSLLNVRSRSTNLVVESQPSPDVTCYHLTVNNVALSATDNTIKIMIVQNGSTLQDKPFLMVSEKSMGLSAAVSFQASDFHQ